MDADVIISGGGPNGMMLAYELCLAGIRPIVLEKLIEPNIEPKARGLVGQVVKVLDRRGLYAPLTGDTEPPQPNSMAFMFAALPLNLSLIDDSPIYSLPVPQQQIAQLLTERATELGADIRRGHEVVGLVTDDSGITLDILGPQGNYQLRCGYLVGADGAHSLVRKQAGIGFPGVSYDRTTNRTADAEVPSEWVDEKSGALRVPGFGTVAPFIPQRTENGGFAFAPLPGKTPMLMTTEWDEPPNDEPFTMGEFRASVRRVLGVDIPLSLPTVDGPHLLRKRVGGNTRVAERFVNGRIALIGDAAHVYTAGGGPGLNLGLQDAINLGWKLAAAVRGAPAELLETYHEERHAAASRMVLYAQTQAALNAPGKDVTALRELFAELLAKPENVQHIADLTAGSDVRYPTAQAHPLTGLLAPDMLLHKENCPVRLAELTLTARPLLIDTTGTLADALDTENVDIVTARIDYPGVTAILIRPDCYVAWASADSCPDIDELKTVARYWFGVSAPELL